jgi:hypothetical protein
MFGRDTLIGVPYLLQSLREATGCGYPFGPQLGALAPSFHLQTLGI